MYNQGGYISRKPHVSEDSEADFRILQQADSRLNRMPTNKELPPQFRPIVPIKQMKERLTRTEFESEDEKFSIWCRLCEDILVEPLCCKKCKLASCQKCFEDYLAQNANCCPSGCRMAIAGGCPRKNAKALKATNFSCLYQSNGCTLIHNYGKVLLHELECSYRHIICSICN